MEDDATLRVDELVRVTGLDLEGHDDVGVGRGVVSPGE